MRGVGGAGAWIMCIGRLGRGERKVQQGKVSCESLNIHMANGQTIYKNRTPSLQQPAQETNSLSAVTSPGSQVL